MIITLLGAESTGKSTLAQALAQHLQAQGQDAVAVGEYLREWCTLHHRTPRVDEQAHIAATQQQRIEAAAALHSVVIADTSPLMIALYSEYVFADLSLYPLALQQQRTCHVTLLSGLDIAWQADGIQRDGAHVRPHMDTLLRQRLDEATIGYRVVYGLGHARLQNAMNCIAEYVHTTRTSSINASKKWVWTCDKCSDPDCEHRLFSQLATPPTAPSSAPVDGPVGG
jgi:nicotinamide riboside kinase